MEELTTHHRVIVFLRYVAFFGWTIGVYVSFNPIINNNQEVGQHSAALSLVARLLFAFVILSSALLFEKFSIQWIAGKFHERSYAERIADQKASIRVLVTLYADSLNTLIPRYSCNAYKLGGIFMSVSFLFFLPHSADIYPTA